MQPHSNMPHPDVPHLDGEQLLQDLETLAQYGAKPGPGLNRVAFSPPDMAARGWVASQMEQVGLQVQTDAAGNTIGRYAGQETAGQEALKPIALGSHTDTVPQGGRYDGALGVLSALACVRALHQAGLRLRHPVEVINFTAEEATMSGATLGSQAMSGRLDPAMLAHTAWDGLPVADHLRAANIDPDQVMQAMRSVGSLAAYLELHIEQGGSLALDDIPIGVVEGIVGIRRYDGVFIGAANHAGTTPMALRQDALVMAAPFISGVRETALAYQIVGTVGKLQVHPGAPNVIPGRVDLQVEIRGLDEGVLDEAEAALIHLAQQHGGQLQPRARKNAVQSDPRLLAAMQAACQALDIPYRQMPSGAGHDAMCIDDIAPQAMLFVPSQNGISHAPEEYTKPEHCILGAQVLLATLLQLDQTLD